MSSMGETAQQAKAISGPPFPVSGEEVTPLKQDKPETPTQQAEELKKLKIPRTKAYVNALKQADSLSETDETLIKAVQALPVNNKLLGILAECGLPGHMIHAIDKWGNIIEHYRDASEMSADLQAGYMAYQSNPGCTSVEVYTYTLCITYSDGTVKFIERKCG